MEWKESLKALSTVSAAGHQADPYKLMYMPVCNWQRSGQWSVQSSLLMDYQRP